jgi:small neutral amino acid transporter SnatA (MarC family)
MRRVGKSGIDARSRLLVCMGAQFIINSVVEIVKSWP